MAFTPVNIPIELFGMLLGMSAVFIGIGMVRKIGVSVFVGGAFILLIFLLTNNVIMGQVVTSSTTNSTSGVTTYTYGSSLFQITQWHEVLGALFGSVFMLLGGLISKL